MEKYLKPSGSGLGSGSKRPLEDILSPERWRKPKKFLSNPKENRKDNATATKNTFENLPTDVEDPISATFQAASKKKATNNTPVITIELDRDWTRQNIRNLIEKQTKDFHMQNRGQNLVKVQCYNAKTHQQLKDGLLTENVCFYTHARRDEKFPKAVIKGLPNFVHDSISNELERLGFAGATVSVLKTYYATECPPILVQLPIGTNMSKFKQIRYLSNCVVDIQRFKPNKKTGTQCYRCQDFGHASSHCNRQPRCVKCAQTHGSWECPKKSRDEPARCCNCHEEHPANYSLCSVRLKYLERIKSKRESLRRPTTSQVSRESFNHSNNIAQIVDTDKSKTNATSISSKIHPVINPPNALTKTTTTTSTKSHHNSITLTGAVQSKQTSVVGVTYNKNSQDFETVEMLEILTTVQAIKQEFAKCQTFMDKVILILTHLGHYV